MIIRKASNGIALEYGGTETSAIYDSDLGKKRMHDEELKLPKTMRDMLLMIAEDIKWDSEKLKEIEIVGYAHSGNKV
ncbi:uncharacterized protein BX664DRAFT_343639 [Halteromyces radiatus]|uniref:uncharacterized protein n=1 Tax=Halteromyces radiatus TaxID=101107 RepID=UPI00221FD27D|nr:uncharacterized protein BX664DRAFT_343639 [Halteromyces radiatus]KAI8077846.1 hypothetical protein BX664DRAFT_343639 [Halteromyces radiatus]